MAKYAKCPNIPIPVVQQDPGACDMRHQSADLYRAVERRWNVKLEEVRKQHDRCGDPSVPESSSAYLLDLFFMSFRI